MKKIYIILTFTGTWLSRVVRVYTRKEYSHVSIALDEDLTKMYSFGRLYPYNPFLAGFVHEGIDHGTFKRFKKTKTKIYSMEIPEEKYEHIEEIINSVAQKKNTYKFNFIGLLALTLNVKNFVLWRFLGLEVHIINVFGLINDSHTDLKQYNR